MKSEQRLDSGTERKVSLNRSDSALFELDEGKKKKSRELLQHVIVQEDRDKDSVSESEKQLIQRFKIYESSQKEILHIITFWDRVQGVLVPSPAAEDGQHDGEDQAPERQAPSGKKYRKDRERQEKLEREKAEKERVEKERAEKERLDKLRATEDDAGAPIGPGKEVQENQEEELKIDVGIPHYELQVSGDPDTSEKNILQTGFLPSVDEVRIDTCIFLCKGIRM